MNAQAQHREPVLRSAQKNNCGAVASEQNYSWRCEMLYWALMFLIVAIIAGVFGFGLVAGTSYAIAKVLFFVFLVLFIASLIFGGLNRPVA
jgi:uncharacterized membrane protein YtjA (UPF0391 family)